MVQVKYYVRKGRNGEVWRGEREGERREGGGREGGRERERDRGVREGGRGEGDREGGREIGREEGRWGGREGEREGEETQMEGECWCGRKVEEIVWLNGGRGRRVQMGRSYINMVKFPH